MDCYESLVELGKALVIINRETMVVFFLAGMIAGYMVWGRKKDG